jgi:hypothetical protein
MHHTLAATTRALTHVCFSDREAFGGDEQSTHPRTRNHDVQYALVYEGKEGTQNKIGCFLTELTNADLTSNYLGYLKLFQRGFSRRPKHETPNRPDMNATERSRSTMGARGWG